MLSKKATLLFLVLTCLCSQNIFAAKAEPLELSNNPQLFLDDYIIAKMVNLDRDMKQPQKHPQNPVMKNDLPWEKRFMFVSSVVYAPEKDKFMAWYTGSEDPNGSPEYYTCYAESKDGVNWEKPMVGKEPFGPYKEHNILGMGGCAFRDSQEPDPNRLYKAGNSSYSPDGINWTENEELKQGWLDAVGKNDTVPSFVWWKDEYLAYVRYQGPETNTIVSDKNSGKIWKNAVFRCTGLSTSKDFKNWTEKQLIFRTDERDGYPWTQAHALCVTVYGDILIGLLPLLHMIPAEENNFLGDFDVQLMVSRDGWNWDRVADRAIFMPCEKSEPMATRAWDFRFHPTSNFIVKDDLVYIYYFATNTRHGEGRSRGVGRLAKKKDIRIHTRDCGLGLATLPADRFVSLRPVNWAGEGILETKPFVFSGNKLLVNADINAGTLEVELLNEAGQVIPGFGYGQSQLSVRDKLRYSVAWKQNDGREKTLEDISENQPIAVRFILTNGDLYAFQIVK